MAKYIEWCSRYLGVFTAYYATLKLFELLNRPKVFTLLFINELIAEPYGYVMITILVY